MATTWAEQTGWGGGVGTPPLLERWTEAQRQSDAVFGLIRPEAIYDRPIPERHRLVFYLGHLEAFDWNLLATRGLALAPFHPEWDRLFAFGIDPVEGDLPYDQASDWPRVEAIEDYNRQVRAKLHAALARTQSEALDQLLQVAIEHRLMHLETLAYLLHQLPYERKQAGPAAAAVEGPAPDNPLLTVEAGTARLGRPRGSGFGWDNEFPEQRVKVAAFRASRFKVTNAEYMEYMEATGQPAPHFWRRTAEGWRFRGMFAETPLAAAAPVWVTQAEAAGYCRWKGGTLPTEAEWQRLAYGAPEGEERAFPWGSEPPAAWHGNFDLRSWDPEAVHAHPAGAGGWGHEDVLGNGWEWTATVFGPLPGFTPFEFYPGYSANFFDGQHFVMKGGSPRTAACMLRRSFRNWFQPRYPYVYAGFRYVSHA